MIEALSDVARTNQLKILETKEDVAKKLFQYLFKAGKGIEHFSTKGWFTKEQYKQPDFYSQRHRSIKNEIQKRLAEHGEEWEYADIQYFLSYSNGDNRVFFLSPNNSHSGWTQLFCENGSNSERILNLVFKFYILSQEFPVETLNGFEELLLLHSRSLTKSENGLVVWGQNVVFHYNYHNVVTLKLARKRRLFLPNDQYSSVDSENIGELFVYRDKNYYFERDLDARRTNRIYFMRFDKDDESFSKFRKTQLYHYQNLMTQFEGFLNACNITRTSLPFQSDHYLENPFITNVESVSSVEIINNSGVDLPEFDMLLLRNLFKHQGIQSLSFFDSGKTIVNIQNSA